MMAFDAANDGCPMSVISLHNVSDQAGVVLVKLYQRMWRLSILRQSDKQRCRVETETRRENLPSATGGLMVENKRAPTHSRRAKISPSLVLGRDR